MRGMRQKTVTAYTPDGYIRIAAIEQIGKTYKPLFEVPWDYVYEFGAFVMWPKGSIRIQTGTERSPAMRKPKSESELTAEDRQELMQKFAELLVDDFYRETGRAEKIKKGVDVAIDTLFLPDELVGVKQETTCDVCVRTS